MIILEPPDTQDERSPLKKSVEIDSAIPSAVLTTAPPPYAFTLPQNPSITPYQAMPHSHHTTAPYRQSPIRRLLVAFAIAGLILLLSGALFDGLYERSRGKPSKGRRHGHAQTVEQTQVACPEGLNRVPDCSCRCQCPETIDDASRVIPIQYQPSLLPKTM